MVKRYSRIFLIITISLLLLGIAWSAYLRYTKGYVWADGTGFEGKTLWEWFGLLIVPAILGFGALLFNQTVRASEQKIATDQQREKALQNYLDKMAELLLDAGLLEKKDNPDDPVVDVAQVRTVTTLRILDKDRRNTLFQFLRDSNLADFILVKASLVRIDLSNTSMYLINLREANLPSANLGEADLLEANLLKAYLFGADLRKANLPRANLFRADLRKANLLEANLGEADLGEADLFGADLRKAYLFRANLGEADLGEADLRKAYLTEADLRGTNLTASDLTGTDLGGAKHDGDTKWPDGFTPPE